VSAADITVGSIVRMRGLPGPSMRVTGVQPLLPPYGPEAIVQWFDTTHCLHTGSIPIDSLCAYPPDVRDFSPEREPGLSTRFAFLPLETQKQIVGALYDLTPTENHTLYPAMASIRSMVDDAYHANKKASGDA